MSQCRVAVTGLGVINPFGGNLEDFFSHLLSGKSAIALLDTEDQHDAPVVPAMQCRHFSPEHSLGLPLSRSMDRFSQLGTTAAFAAWDDAGLIRDDNSPEKVDMGVAWGTGVGGVMTFEKGYQSLYTTEQKLVHPLSVVMAMNNAAAANIAINLGLGGSCLTYSVACASSSVAIGEAFRNIRDGKTPLMLAGGSEAPLANGVIRAWEALRVIAPGNADSAYSACRPFSKNRSGLVLGEGAGALVLEEWEHAIARGAHIYAELSGYGTTCDHTHLVRPNPEGETRAMQLALTDAGLGTNEINYINAHGTATREGDPAEITALKTVFGTHAATLPVSATKSMHGHLLGAAGAVEAIITVLAVHKNAIPPTAHLNDIDPGCTGVQHITGAALTGVSIRAALSNSFAFGGVNAVLAFRAAY